MDTLPALQKLLPKSYPYDYRESDYLISTINYEFWSVVTAVVKNRNLKRYALEIVSIILGVLAVAWHTLPIHGISAHIDFKGL